MLFTLRDIAAGEEILYDYMFAPEHPDDVIPCDCGAPKCRGTLNIQVPNRGTAAAAGAGGGRAAAGGGGGGGGGGWGGAGGGGGGGGGIGPSALNRVSARAW